MAVNTDLRKKDISIMLFVALLVFAGYCCVFTMRIGSREICMVSSSALLGICLFGVFFLLVGPRGERSRRIFALQMSVLSGGIAAGLAAICIFLRNGAVPVRDFFPAILVCGNVYAFILLMYPFEVLCAGRTTFGKYFKLFLPALLTGLPCYGYVRLTGHRMAEAWLCFFFIAYPAWMIFMVLRQRKRYLARASESFPDAGCTVPGWLDYYLFCYFLILVSGAVVVSIPDQQSVLMLSCCFLLFFGFSFYNILRRQTADLPAFPVEGNPAGAGMAAVSDPADSGSPDTAGDKYRFVDKMPQYKVMLERWMEQEKPYLNADFKLLDVMQALPLNRSYLSRMFNEAYGETFFCFVMRHRIRESIRMLTSRPDLTVACIAEACGFSSASVFGRAFLKHVGMTPKAYRNCKSKVETNPGDNR